MKYLLLSSGLLLFASFIFPFPVHALSWDTHVNTFQITSDSSQQNRPHIYRDTVMWSDWRGGTDTSIDIYRYDVRKSQSSPVIIAEGQQWLAGFDNRYVVYNQFIDTSDPKSYDVHIYDLKKKVDHAITDDIGSQEAHAFDGRFIVYMDGGACGTLYAYDIRRETTKLIAEEACTPVNMDLHTVVWNYAAAGGTNVYGYDLLRDRQLTIADADGFQETPNIFRFNAVWTHREGNYFAIYMKNIHTNREKLLYETTDATLAYPALSHQYVIWSESTSQHVGGVKGIDLITGSVFEIQEQRPHQNSHTVPRILRDTAVWQAWRTGNGDIYGAHLDRSVSQ